MKPWSVYFQNKDFLEKTRMHLLNRDLLPLVVNYLGLKPGMKVLDIGCGSGEFDFYLAEAANHVSFTGIDLDPLFIDYANKSADRMNNERGNTFSFFCSDAASLPFEKNSFDLVVSCTFFNSMPKFGDALNEMKRVCREGGKIASLTAMSVTDITESGGIYPDETAKWKRAFDELRLKAYNMYDAFAPTKEYLQGINTKYIPILFHKAGLKNVSAWPLGQFFSLSNAAIPDEEKRRYIELDYTSEIQRFDAICREKPAEDIMTEAERREYCKLLSVKRDYLLANIGENAIWEWVGSANLLIAGTKYTTDEEMVSALLRFGRENGEN